jgi:hypothetical protein
MFLSIRHATGTPLGESDALGRPTELEGAATAGHVGPVTYPPLKRLGSGWTERLQSVAQAGVDGVAALRLTTRLGWRGRGSVARATGAPLHSDGFGLEARGWPARAERWFTGRNSSEVDDITDAAWRAQEEGTT